MSVERLIQKNHIVPKEIKKLSAQPITGGGGVPLDPLCSHLEPGA